MRRIALILELSILIALIAGAGYKYLPDMQATTAPATNVSPSTHTGMLTDGCPVMLKGCTCALGLDGKPEPVPPANLKFMLPEDCIKY